ncbi:WS/DGAT/MGAT family O-acyltransferase [Psychrobacter sp. FDAARGOS_221]|uniref:WS/DGAT/MGAT family O-acyltransferase n=1 Tax=Psychrobacter sp. FDAARGOS_221 TaxID=1975705 RepID=UPI000BB537CD|nr:wax ester/triacylglycerol synthase family O-acyltransferase [Psychrobacter sp. FDAARGOS_221]PNK61320.1 wax ester/triacylglycerol synthase family O-acyltransferase [Psychrobacter sp. FDAARGOS_221]
MRLLSIVDLLFLLLEKRKQPMHVGGLFLFEQPEDADPDYVLSLVQQMQSSKTPPTFPFNQVLHNLAYWEVDEDFDVEHHLRHIALPKPARVRELLAYISKEHGRLLDRARPLWECHIIEGIEPESEGRPKRFGLYFKIHHSLVDGVAAMRLVQKSLSQSPNETITLPLWALMMRHRYQLETILPPKRTFGAIVKDQLKTAKPVVSELAKSLSQGSDSNFVRTTQAPASILNQSISSSRRFTAGSFDLERFKRVAKNLNVSINDVVLAICSGALRQYLESMNELPKEPLIAWVPYSMRKDESAAGNQFAFILCNLGTHLDSPLERLKLVHNSMNDGKSRFGRMTQSEVINYSLVSYSWEFVNVLTSIYPKKQAFNLIISNVPGSKKKLYWNGSELRALYPASILFNGQAMNITLASYLDRIEFGIVACSKTLPKVQNMLKLLEDELVQFEQVCHEIETGVRE